VLVGALRQRYPFRNQAPGATRGGGLHRCPFGMSFLDRVELENQRCAFADGQIRLRSGVTFQAIEGNLAVGLGQLMLAEKFGVERGYALSFQ